MIEEQETKKLSMAHHVPVLWYQQTQWRFLYNAIKCFLSLYAAKAYGEKRKQIERKKEKTAKLKIHWLTVFLWYANISPICDLLLYILLSFGAVRRALLFDIQLVLFCTVYRIKNVLCVCLSKFKFCLSNAPRALCVACSALYRACQHHSLYTFTMYWLSNTTILLFFFISIFSSYRSSFVGSLCS